MVFHPDAFGEYPASASTFQGALRTAQQLGHAFFGDLVDVTFRLRRQQGLLAATWAAVGEG
ncbi:hypothetical protein CR917_12715 [Pseudomonas sp. BRM28]|nr:hypothetical protein CR917_12715 [Pseudomonas sp. BRM28]